jgi:hypothetical protein
MGWLGVLYLPIGFIGVPIQLSACGMVGSSSCFTGAQVVIFDHSEFHDFYTKPSHGNV